METNKKLKAKDLINVGIYTAIYIVFFFVAGMLNAIPVLYPFLYVLIPLISGIPFMLFLTKTEKFGIGGYVVFGLIADLVLKAGKYKNFKVDVIGYWLFSCGMIGCQAPMWVMADTYMAQVEASMGEQYASELAHYMPSWMGIAAIAIIFIGSLLGALLGRKMLKKHFERAGIV